MLVIDVFLCENNQTYSIHLSENDLKIHKK